MALFFRKIDKLPKKVLISRTDRIGDFVLSLPVFQALKEINDCEITVLCNPLNKPLLKNNPFIDHIIQTDELEDQYTEINYHEVFISLVNDPFITAKKGYLKQIPKRVGPLSKLGMLSFYNYPIVQKRSKSLKNETEYNLEVLEIFNRNINYKIKPRLYVDENEIESWKNKFSEKISSFPIQRSVVLHSGMNGSALNMGLNFYLDLLESLLNENCNIITTGHSEIEKSKNEKLLKRAEKLNKSELVLDLSKCFNLRELAILYSQVGLFIGPSTGTTHIANAVGTPIVSFYPPIKVQSKRRWEPYLANSNIFSPQVTCGQKYKCINEKCPDYYCMDTIDLNRVVETILTINEQ